MLPWLTPRFFRKLRRPASELEAKFLLFCLFGLGALASWAGSEAVLPAYVIGMVLAGTVGKDHVLIRRLRTLTFGLLTPFYFIRAGAFVSIPSLVAAPPVKGTGMGVLAATNGVGDFVSSALVGGLWSLFPAHIAVGFFAAGALQALGATTLLAMRPGATKN